MAARPASPTACIASGRDVLNDDSIVEADKCSKLRGLIHSIVRSRTTLRRADGSVISLMRATSAELFALLESEANAAIARTDVSSMHVYKRAFRRFRVCAHVAEHERDGSRCAGPDGPCIFTEADAVAAGALDFAAAASWHGDAARVAALGIAQVAPPGVPAARRCPGCTCDAPCIGRGGVWMLLQAPGVYILPSSMCLPAQVHWTLRILQTLVEPPNRRNIDAGADPDYSNAALQGRYFSASAASRASGGYGTEAPVAAPAVSDEVAVRRVAEEPRFVTDLLDTYVRAFNDKPTATNTTPLARLTWATLGYQYDWTARSYHLPGDADFHLHEHVRVDGSSSQRWHAVMPSDVGEFGAAIASACSQRVGAAACELGRAFGYSDAQLGLPMSLTPSAGIINFYHPEVRQPMGMHVDDMERTPEYPVVSVSIGCTGVFLVGDTTKTMAPIPILIRSGDMLLLSGASRLAFHGVPRVLPGTAPPELLAAITAATSAGPALQHFLQATRINMNLRQVM